MKLLTIISILLFMQTCTSQENHLNNNKNIEMSKDNFETATFGGGCFWCVEAVFEQLLGVKSVTSGFAGGHTENPSYKEVCTGTTGHAEVIQIVFDPQQISFDELLEVFWTVHDPTQLNRQGNDIGEQYRSIILYENEEQKLIAQRSINDFEASELYEGNFTTQLVPLNKFWVAEGYLQNYYQTVGDQNPYCTLVIKPKVDKFYKEFYDKLKPEYK
ncbi:MAG: peptide-methionine (S)-S-oxide reductase MsrA [Weeksellaceae bacterium]|nr:peptide-methionine (S)-S-oxide reductase MsrA [Weeksellaceae bacterium]